MPLPDGFNEFEFLQDTIRKLQNRIVRKEFSGLGGDDWDPDISISEGALRHACTHKDNDTAEMTQLRNFLFYWVYKKGEDFQNPIYGLPIIHYQSIRKFKPQVFLYFKEDLEDVEAGYDPIPGEISFRLMDKESETVTSSILQTTANRINTAFASGNGRIWRRGKDMASYTDVEKGYGFKLLCRDKTEIKQLIASVLGIQAHTPDWQNLNYKVNDEPMKAFPTVPKTVRILGESYKEPRYRPICSVRFQYAVMILHGRKKVVPLVDRTGKFPKALIKA